MKLLHIDSSILCGHSVSRTLSAAIVDRLTASGHYPDVVYRDVVAAPIPALTGAYLAGQSEDVQHDQAHQENLALGGTVLEEFLAADVVVIGVALYNFTIASQLKAWVDRILVAGKTFHYTDKGAQGLVGGKRIILAIARGGVYSPGSPHAAYEHAESYMRTALGFIGVTAPEVIVAEGIALGPEHREASVKGALDAIGQLKTA